MLLQIYLPHTSPVESKGDVVLWKGVLLARDVNFCVLLGKFSFNFIKMTYLVDDLFALLRSFNSLN